MVAAEPESSMIMIRMVCLSALIVVTQQSVSVTVTVILGTSGLVGWSSGSPYESYTWSRSPELLQQCRGHLSKSYCKARLVASIHKEEVKAAIAEWICLLGVGMTTSAVRRIQWSLIVGGSMTEAPWSLSVG